MQRLAVLALALSLAACGNPAQQAAQKQADAIKQVGVDASSATPGADVALKTDADGCKDKAKAEAVIAAKQRGDSMGMIKLISEGMKDQSCRGFIDGLKVKVDHVEGDRACILPGDDPENKQCFWIEKSAI